VHKLEHFFFKTQISSSTWKFMINYIQLKTKCNQKYPPIYQKC